MIITHILLMRKLRHGRLGTLPRFTELVVGFGFEPGLSDLRTQALRLSKHGIIKANKSVKWKQDKIGMRWNHVLFPGRKGGRYHLPPYPS